MITPDLIRKLHPAHPAPKETAAALQVAAARFGITDPQSVAAWIANLSVESNLVPQRENLNYRSPDRLKDVWPSRFDRTRGGKYDPAQYTGQPVKLANLVYAGRLGNGDVGSGDGWAFRGWGHVQITGRGNTLAVERLINQPLTAQPALLDDPGICALAAAAYWTRLSNADQLARAGDIRGTRRAVNGPAMLHADLMLARYKAILPLVQAAAPSAPTVLLVPPGGGEPVPWDGSSHYSGLDLGPVVPQLDVLYPVPGGPWVYQSVRVWRRQGGVLVLERTS